MAQLKAIQAVDDILISVDIDATRDKFKKNRNTYKNGAQINVLVESEHMLRGYVVDKAIAN
jgi:hypothetical protein